jgi:chromosome partitioning protein
LGVTEYAQDDKAAEEIRQLWRWVFNKLVEGKPFEGSAGHEQIAKQAAG